MICACQVWFIFVGQYLKYLTDYLQFILLRSILDEIDRQSTRLTVRRGHWDVGPWTALEAQHHYRVSVQDLVVTDEHCTWQLPTLDGLDAVERNGRRRIREGCGRGWPISASCDLDLWPPDLQSRPFHALAPRTTCTNLHQNRWIYFQNILLTSLATNKQTAREHYVYSQSSLAEG